MSEDGWWVISRWCVAVLECVALTPSSYRLWSHVAGLDFLAAHPPSRYAFACSGSALALEMAANPQPRLCSTFSTTVTERQAMLK